VKKTSAEQLALPVKGVTFTGLAERVALVTAMSLIYKSAALNLLEPVVLVGIFGVFFALS